MSLHSRSKSRGFGNILHTVISQSFKYARTAIRVIASKRVYMLSLAIFVLFMGVVFIKYAAFPHVVSDRPVPPFAPAMTVLSESIRYKISPPLVGQAVIFRPDETGQDYIGLIAATEQNSEKGLQYIVYSSPDDPWKVRRSQIVARIYYPFMSQPVRAKAVEMLLAGKAFVPPSDSAPPQSALAPSVYPTDQSKQVQPTSVPSPTKVPQITSRPTGVVDGVPPTVTILGGPIDGSSSDATSFCFPLSVGDNLSTYPKVEVRTRFDNAVWTNWGTDLSPCYQNVSAGAHAFAVQSRDEAGNLSKEVGRNFIIRSR